MTRHWGSGAIFQRIALTYGEPDVAFGKTDGIPPNIKAIDLTNGYAWKSLPFNDNAFRFGYWDPPYDSMYKKEALEIWRTCTRLAVLHTSIYPTSWFPNGKREGMIAVTFGPLKQIRCLQFFIKPNFKNKSLESFREVK
jgi:hypothetical protein